MKVVGSIMQSNFSENIKYIIFIKWRILFIKDHSPECLNGQFMIQVNDISKKVVR